jgi:acylglycerol lipase
VQHQTGSLLASDGIRLFTQHWLPAEPQAVLVLAHGYAEHSSRYAALGEFLAQHHLAVYALDHRGHGRSEGERANIRVFQQYGDDLLRFIDAVREKHPAQARFLLGHSMGGVIASQFVIAHPHKLAGLLLSAPYLQSAIKVSPLLMSVSGLVSSLLPALPTIRLDTSKLSRDAAVVKAYQADPMVYNGATKARLGTELTSAGPYALARAASIKLPILIMHGTADGIADVAGSKTLFETISSTDKSLKLYEGFYHEILNEPQKQQVYQDVLEWILSRSSD